MNNHPSTLRHGVAAAHAGDRKAAYTIALQQVVFALLPLIVLVVLLRWLLVDANSRLAVDFRQEYYVAAERLVQGGRLYVWKHQQIVGGVAFPYPALSALLFAPFTLFSLSAASVLFTLVCLALAPFTLWVLGARDWRVYGATLLWLPVFAAWQAANETMLLAAIVALVWRYRENPVAAGLLTAVAISLKPFVWPLALWLLVTRRWHASLCSLIFGVVLNLLAWMLVGFDQFRAYVQLSSTVTDALWRSGYGVLAVAHHLGFGRGVGESLEIVASAALAIAVVRVGWRGRDLQALTLTVLLMLIASPLVWAHYFSLLLVPVALARPRFHWLWVLPVLMWRCPASGVVANWQEAVLWVLVGTMIVSVLRTAQE